MDKFISHMIDNSDELNENLVKNRLYEKDDEKEEKKKKAEDDEESIDDDEDIADKDDEDVDDKDDDKDTDDEDGKFNLKDTDQPDEEEIDKIYLGQNADSHYYIVGTEEASSDEDNDVQVLDQEGELVWSAKENEIDATTKLVDIIMSAVQDIEIEYISYDIAEKYFFPEMETTEDEEEEEKEDDFEKAIGDESEPEEDIETDEESEPVESKKRVKASKIIESYKKIKEAWTNEMTGEAGDLIDIATAKHGWAVAEQLQDILQAHDVGDLDADKMESLDLNHNALSIIYSFIRTRPETDLIADLFMVFEEFVDKGYAPDRILREQATVKTKYTFEGVDYNISLLKNGNILLENKEMSLSDEAIKFYKINEEKDAEQRLQELSFDILRALSKKELKDLKEQIDDGEECPHCGYKGEMKETNAKDEQGNVGIFPKCPKCGKRTSDIAHYWKESKNSKGKSVKGYKRIIEALSSDDWILVNDAIEEIVQKFQEITGVDPVKTIDLEGGFNQNIIDKTVEPIKNHLLEDDYLAQVVDGGSLWEAFVYELDDKMMEAYADEAAERDKEAFDADVDREVAEKMVKKGNKWQVQSESGKNLGTYDTKTGAEKRLKQVEYFKQKNESKLKEDKPVFNSDKDDKLTSIKTRKSHSEFTDQTEKDLKDTYLNYREDGLTREQAVRKMARTTSIDYDDIVDLFIEMKLDDFSDTKEANENKESLPKDIKEQVNILKNILNNDNKLI